MVLSVVSFLGSAIKVQHVLIPITRSLPGAPRPPTFPVKREANALIVATHFAQGVRVQGYVASK